LAEIVRHTFIRSRILISRVQNILVQNGLVQFVITGFLEASSKNHLLARRARDLQFDSGFSSGE
jgi:hypothetical protein